MFKKNSQNKIIENEIKQIQDGIEKEIDKAIDELPFKLRALYNVSFGIYFLVFGAGISPIREYLITHWGTNELIGLIAAGLITFTPFLGSITAVWAIHVTSYQYPIWVGIIYFIILPFIAQLSMNYVRTKAILSNSQ